MASKKTPELIPLCHPLNITKIEIDFELGLFWQIIERLVIPILTLPA